MKSADAFGAVATRLRARGFAVTEQAGWRDRGHGDITSFQHVTVHHTATGGSDDYRSLKLVTDGRSDLAGPLCNWGVGRQGGIYIVAAGLAYHAGATWQTWQDNAHSVGIEAENNGVGEPWNPAIMGALTALVQELRREFSIPQDRVQGHKETCKPAGRKIDPANFDMNGFRSLTNPPNLAQEDFLSALSDAEQREVLDRLRNLDGIVTRSGLGTKLASLVDGGKTQAYLDQYILWADGKLTAIVKKLGA